MKILKIINEKSFNIECYNALQLSISLKKSGNEVLLMCPDDSDIYKEAQKNKIEVLSLGPLEKIGFAKLPQVDIVSVYSFFPTLPILLKKINTKNIPIFYHQISFSQKDVLREILKIQNLFYRIFPSCHSIYDEMTFSGLDIAKLFIVPPVLNMPRWESAKLIKPAMFLKRPFKIGTSYRIINQKELEIFLQIAKAVIEKEPNTNFVMVGPKYEKIRIIARQMGISHKIDMLDWRTDMPEVMAMLHIFIKTNITKTISRSLIEAMASGVACIVPRIEGMTDFIFHDQSGLIVEPNNIEQYVNAILLLIKNPPLCQAMSALAYNHVNNNMSLNVVNNLLKILYEEAILFKNNL